MQAHKRSGGICQFCRCNAGATVSYDLWRQMTIEHVIGKKRGGDLKEITIAISERFPEITSTYRNRLVQRITEANTITACSLCNSLTSQHGKNGKKIADMLREATGTPDEVVNQVLVEIANLFEAKRAEVDYKHEAIRDAFEKLVEPDLRQLRCADNTVI